MCIASITLVKMPYLLFSFILHETTLRHSFSAGRLKPPILNAVLHESTAIAISL